MKILIVCSKAFYSKVEEVKTSLQNNWHEVFLPTFFDKPELEEILKKKSIEELAKFKIEAFKKSENTIKNMDAILVINLEKNWIQNYIWWSTFLEIYDAFRMNKKIFLYNPIPEWMLKDELIWFEPIIIDGQINLI